MVALEATGAVPAIFHEAELFRHLPDAVLAELTKRVVAASFPAGTTILHEGESSEDAYLILRGKAAVGSSNLIGQQIVLAVLGPGDTFGEGGLVTSAVRTATVSSLTPLETYRISRETFEWLGAQDPEFTAHVRQRFDVLQIDRFLKQASPFAHLPRPVLRRLVAEFRTHRAGPADAIVREGDPGDTFFLIHTGRVEVTRRGKRLAILGPGDFFGEIALTTAGPRTATVRALEEATLLTLSREAFQAITTENRSVADQIKEVVRIRFDGAPSQSVALPDPVTTFIPFVPGARRRSLWIVFGAGAALFLALAAIAAVTRQPVVVYGALLCGALVAPTLFLTYLARANLLAQRPETLIVTSLLAAGIGLPLAILIEGQLGFGPGHLTSALGVAVVEEFAKAIAVVWLLRNATLRFRMDGILFGAAAAMGFAAFENALYALARLNTVDEMLAVLSLRSILAPFGHGAWTALICATIWGRRQDRGAPGWTVLAAFGAAVLLHTLWDWRPLPHLLSLPWVLGVAVMGIVALRLVLHRALREETGAVSVLNPGATGALGPMLRVQCAACGQVVPAGVRYCPRCGVAVRVAAA